jgi:Tfp pilus assembly protein PilP
MQGFQKYRKRVNSIVTAVQLKLETTGFTYTKWGGVQQCEQGDWIIDNNGDIYTIKSDIFTKTYLEISTGRYIKTALIWARVATESGVIKTEEGSSEYKPGDYIVFNEGDVNGYCMNAEKFNEMYEKAE